MTSWTCAECEAVNRETGKFCAACGSPRNETTPRQPATLALPWEQPGFRQARPEDTCTEQGCTKTVAEHMRDFQRAAARISAQIHETDRAQTSAESA